MSDRINISISIGDIRGVGLEVLVKSLTSLNFTFIPILIGYEGVDKLIESLNIPGMIKTKYISKIEETDELDAGNLYILPLSGFDDNSISEQSASELALSSLDKAIELVVSKICHYLVTLPLSKSSIDAIEPGFRGHTEYIAGKADIDRPVMSFYQDGRITGLVTTHIPLSEVSRELTTDHIVHTTKETISFYETFSERSPRCAILSLNPHAGEDGLLGSEEEDIIKPAIEIAREEGYEVTGPYPPDAFYSRDNYRNYDCIIAMYHDQGLIPVKMSGPSVNTTLGLPFIRLSPDHGPAYDITHKDRADYRSMLETLNLVEVLTRKGIKYVK